MVQLAVPELAVRLTTGSSKPTPLALTLSPPPPPFPSGSNQPLPLHSSEALRAGARLGHLTLMPLPPRRRGRLREDSLLAHRASLRLRTVGLASVPRLPTPF